LIGGDGWEHDRYRRSPPPKPEPQQLPGEKSAPSQPKPGHRENVFKKGEKKPHKPAQRRPEGGVRRCERSNSADASEAVGPRREEPALGEPRRQRAVA